MLHDVIITVRGRESTYTYLHTQLQKGEYR